jgi:hypothetical protein
VCRLCLWRQMHDKKCSCRHWGNAIYTPEFLNTATFATILKSLWNYNNYKSLKGCYGLNSVHEKFTFWHSYHQYLKMWAYVEAGWLEK